MANPKPPEKTLTHTSFTVDAEHTGTIEVPTITRLLNRKRLKKQAEDEGSHINTQLLRQTVSSDHQEVTQEFRPEKKADTHSTSVTPPPFRPPAPQQMTEPESTETETKVSGELKLEEPPEIQVKPSARLKAVPNAGLLAEWNATRIRNSQDPLAKAIARLIDVGVDTLLFLAISAPRPGARTPTFLAQAHLGGNASLREIWSGMEWDPAVTPYVWNEFVKKGFVWIPSTATSDPASQMPALVTLRSAFGVPEHCHSTLIRIGSSRACRGLLMAFSEFDFQTGLVDVLPSFTSGKNGNSSSSEGTPSSGNMAA